jgi:hypothetical protein
VQTREQFVLLAEKKLAYEMVIQRGARRPRRATARASCS